MLRTTSVWSGFTGAPGYTNLYFEHQDPPSATANAATDASRALFVGLSSMLPNDVTVTTSPLVEVIDDAEGELLSVITSTTTLTPVTGADSGIWAAASGIVYNWKTAGIHHGHHVKGRTFAVPMGGVTYNASGGIASTPLTSLNAAGAAYVAFPGCDPVVWARPAYGPRPVGGGPRPLLRAGTHFVINAFSVGSKVAVLRSRRD
jgi:hypothetical protein